MGEDRERLTWWQKGVKREIRKRAGKGPHEALTQDDWAATWALHHTPSSRVVHWIWHRLPSSPRCGMCGAPFAGAGRLVVRPLGFRPSRKNPTICATCVEASPPGGMNMQVGIVFADLRGFTALSERANPADSSALLNRFYGCAEDVLLPEALIDKLIGDEVMALYLPLIQPRDRRDRLPQIMVDHARELLSAVGYGSARGPFVEMGIGVDWGEAFVGNVGHRAVYDFTAVGDVVNTAARLQSQARSGEVLVSHRLAGALLAPPGERVELELKGKQAPEVAYRLTYRRA
jgi:adenylate cyclase